MGLLKALVVSAIGLPVAVVADVVTLGGVCTDNGGTYTGDVVDAAIDAAADDD